MGKGRPRMALAFGHVNYPAPGESKKRKAWPLAHFARLAWRLRRELGARIFWVGNEREAAWLPRLRRPPALAVFDQPFAVAAAVLKRCDLVIANDNGLMHLANAVGTPVLALFGPTSQVKNAPWNPGARVLSLGLQCQPCYRCNAGMLPCDSCCWCMKGLKPGMVFEAAKEMLSA